jgi:hypothetical protein
LRGEHVELRKATERHMEFGGTPELVRG